MVLEVTTPPSNLKIQWFAEPISNFVASQKATKLSSLAAIPPLLASLSSHPSVSKYLADFSKPEKIFLPALVKAREVADFTVPDLERALLNISKVSCFSF